MISFSELPNYKIVTEKESKVKDFIEKVGKVKYSNDFSLRFCIVDDERLFLMVMDENTHPEYDFGIWVNAPSFVKSMGNIFDLHWKE